MGTGKPVVLIHGWMATSTMWWGDHGLNTVLARAFSVITPDCRRHGRSGKPHDLNEYGPAMGKDLVRRLDHLKIQKAHWVGYFDGSDTGRLSRGKLPRSSSQRDVGRWRPVVELAPEGHKRTASLSRSG